MSSPQESPQLPYSRTEIPKETPRLPQEMLDEIVNQARDHLNTLKSCSLVCHSLRLCAQKYMLRSIKQLTTDELVLEFLRAIEGNTRIARYIHRISTTAHQLAGGPGSQPSIITLLSAIRLHAPTSSVKISITRSHLGLRASTSPVSFSHISVAVLISCLPHITCLDLSEFSGFPLILVELCSRLTTLRVAAVPHCTPLFKMMLSTCIRISALENVASLQLRDLQGSLPLCLLVSCVRLERLRLNNVGFQGQEVTALYTNPRPQLEELVCQFFDERDLKTLGSIMDLNKIRDLTCRIDPDRGFGTKGIQYVLDQCTSSLETLSVNSSCAFLEQDEEFALAGRPFYLSRMLNLKELCFSTLIDADDNKVNISPSRPYILDASLATIFPEKSKLETMYYHIQVELDASLLQHRYGRVRLDMRDPPAFLQQASWKDLDGTLVALAGVRPLSVCLCVNVILLEKNRQLYDRESWDNDSYIFDDTMGKWAEDTFAQTVRKSLEVNLEVWGSLDECCSD